MTLSVDAHYKQRWDTQVRLRFQGRGFQLKGTVMPPVQIGGEKFYFLRSGSLSASKWGGRGQAVQVQNGDEDKVEITSDEWDSAYHLYDRDNWMGVPGEEQTRQKQAANALGTKADAIIYSAIMSATIPSGNIFGDYSKGLDPYMLKQAEACLFDNFTPTDGRIFMPVPASQFQRLTTYKIFQNSEWLGVQGNDRIKASQGRTYGELNVFQGEKTLFDPYVGTLGPSSGASVRIRVWHSECVGAGHVAPEQMRHEWTRQGPFKRWMVQHTLDGGAVVIEPKGIVEFRLKADALIESEVMRTVAA